MNKVYQIPKIIHEFDVNVGISDALSGEILMRVEENYKMVIKPKGKYMPMFIYKYMLNKVIYSKVRRK